MAFLRSGSSSPLVRVCPSATKIGSYPKPFSPAAVARDRPRQPRHLHHLAPVGVDRDGRAHERRPTVLAPDVGELGEQQVEVRLVVAVAPAPARAEDPRRPAHDVDRDPRVVGDRDDPRVRRERPRLDQRVGLECLAVLDGLLRAAVRGGDDLVGARARAPARRGSRGSPPPYGRCASRARPARPAAPSSRPSSPASPRPARPRPTRPPRRRAPPPASWPTRRCPPSRGPAARRALACRTAPPRPCPGPPRTARARS